MESSPRFHPDSAAMNVACSPRLWGRGEDYLWYSTAMAPTAPTWRGSGRSDLAGALPAGAFDGQTVHAGNTRAPAFASPSPNWPPNAGPRWASTLPSPIPGGLEKKSSALPLPAAVRKLYRGTPHAEASCSTRVPSARGICRRRSISVGWAGSCSMSTCCLRWRPMTGTPGHRSPAWPRDQSRRGP